MFQQLTEYVLLRRENAHKNIKKVIRDSLNTIFNFINHVSVNTNRQMFYFIKKNL